MIADARKRVAVSANAAITLLYWHIGERINREVLGNQRAEYGKKIIGNGFGINNDDWCCGMFSG